MIVVNKLLLVFLIKMTLNKFIEIDLNRDVQKIRTNDKINQIYRFKYIQHIYQFDVDTFRCIQNASMKLFISVTLSPATLMLKNI